MNDSAKRLYSRAGAGPDPRDRHVLVQAMRRREHGARCDDRSRAPAKRTTRRVSQVQFDNRRTLRRAGRAVTVAG